MLSCLDCKQLQTFPKVAVHNPALKILGLSDPKYENRMQNFFQTAEDVRQKDGLRREK